MSVIEFPIGARNDTAEPKGGGGGQPPDSGPAAGSAEALILWMEAPGEAPERRCFGLDPVAIGRDETCAVMIEAADVSRWHAFLRVTRTGVSLTDVSSNGTLVEGRVVQRRAVELAPDTIFQIGPFRFRAELSGTQAAKFALEDAQPSARKTLKVPVSLRREIHKRLLDQLDLVRLERNRMNDHLLRAKVQAALAVIIKDLAASLPAGTDVARLEAELTDEVLGLGPLEQLLRDPEITEIMVLDARTVYAERRGKIELTSLHFTDEDALRAVLERIVMPLGRRIDESSPLVDARLKDGSRVNAVVRPLALRGTCITIRKFSDKPFGIEDLISFGTFNSGMARFLTRAVRARKNILISGGTGSGKTTLLNVLSAAIPSRERIVTIEDAAELRLAQPHVVSLESRPPNMEGRGEITIRDLVRNALRMRPDRIIVGESRGPEALDMLQAMNTGHEGSMTTTHANSTEEALKRIETLVLMSGIDLPSRAIREQISRGIHVVVQQSRLPDGSRRVTAVSEVLGLDDEGRFEVREIFGFRRTGTGPGGTVLGEFYTTGYLPSFLGEFIAQGLVAPGEAYL